MTVWSFPVGAAILSIAALAPVHAQSLTGNVGSAGITRGERAIEARIGFDDDSNLAGRLHYDHAFTERYQLRVIGSFSQPDSEDFEFSALTLENWFQWNDEASDGSGFNGGLRFAYGIANDSGPDEAEVRLTITDKFAEHWEWRTNVIAEMEVGSGREKGVSLESRFRLTRKFDVDAFSSSDFRAGFELFSEFGNTRDIPDFGDQAHQIGPVVQTSWGSGVFMRTAVRFGLTDGSDDAMSIITVGQEF